MSSIDESEIDQATLLTDFTLADLQLGAQPFVSTDSTDSSNQSSGSFLDPIAEAQLNDIKQALISGDDLLLILGPEGSGKSTLLTQLGANSGQRIQCFSVRGSERFSTTNLFAGMLEAFKKQPPNDLKLMLDDLIPCLQGMADHNTLGAVVLDDADMVSPSELTKLLSGMLYINSSNETLLRVTLAAPTEFEERIPELLPEGADLPYSSLAMDAFDMDRARDYLDFRLQQAGFAGEFPFSDDDLAAINNDAGGRHGDLHVFAAQHLNSRDAEFVPELPPELMAGKAAKSSGKRSFGGLKLLTGALALAMIFAGLFWLKPKTNDVPDDRYVTKEKVKVNTANSSDNQDIALLNEEKAAAEKIAAAQAAAQAAANGTASSQTSSSQTNSSASQSASDNSAASSADASASTAAAKAEAQLQAKREQEAAEKAAAEEAEKQRLAEAEAKAAAEKKAAEEQAAKAEAERQAKLAEEQAAREEEAKAKAEQEQAAAAASSTISNLESPNWILTQNPALFTVQMSAATDRQSVENFLTRNQLDAPNSIFSFERNGATWYALVHGLYGSIEEARRDIEKMPESARSNQPWIRAVGRIQNALKE